MRLRDIALAAALSVLAGSATAQTTPAAPEASPTTPAQPQAQPGATGATSAPAPAPATITRQLTVDAVEDMDLVASGATDEIGDVEGVVESNADKKQFLLIERGGILGIGAKKLAIPLENLTVQNDKLVLRNMNVAQLDEMAAFDNENNAFRELEDSQQVTFSTQP